jgi:pimeloyl-ACP methyl ester carboxylesterase
MLVALAVCTAGLVLLTALGQRDLPAPQRHSFNCTADGSRWPYLVQQTAKAPEAICINLYGHYSDHHQGMDVTLYNGFYLHQRVECLIRNWLYVCPWYGGNSWMGPVAESGMVDLIAVLKETHGGLPVYLVGGSMGGSSALVFGVRRPDLVEGIAVRCPAGDIESYYEYAAASDNPTLQNIADAIRIHYTADGHTLSAELRARSALQNVERLTMPLHICHGASDEVIPVGATRALVARLSELGRRVEYVEIPGGGHDAPVASTQQWGEVLDFIAGVRPRRS